MRTDKSLTQAQTLFILTWYSLINILDYEFGFIGVKGMEAQLNAAIFFLLEEERNWELDYTNGRTDLNFFYYFEDKGRQEGLRLPDNFAHDMKLGMGHKKWEAV